MDVIDISAEKKAFRIEVKNTVAKLSPAQKGLESAIKCANFVRSSVFLQASVIFGFMPMNDELDILPILKTALENGKQVLLPKIRGSSNMDFYFIERDFYKETEKSLYGIYEPSSRERPASIEGIFKTHSSDEVIVLVPGLAFGRDNSRLGRGKGFYDVFLSGLFRFYTEKGECSVEKKPRYIGVCYDSQVFNTVPHSESDVFMDCLI